MAQKSRRSSKKGRERSAEERPRSISEVGRSLDELTDLKHHSDVAGTLNHIETLARRDANVSLDTPEKLRLFLMSWWSRHYQRPLKDPVLLSYTLEELIYEFFNHIERTKAAEQQLESDNDRMEEERTQEALDWAEQEELKELERLNAQQVAESANEKTPHKPTQDDIDWMNKKIQEAKEIHGDDFGENIDEDFE